MNIKQKFGKQIKQLRLQKGWSQEKLALNADLDRTYIPGIEAGCRNVSLLTIEKLATVFGLSVSELLKF